MRESIQIIANPTILSDSIINHAIQEYLKRGYGVDIAKAVRDLEEEAKDENGDCVVFDNEMIAREWAMEVMHEHGYVRPARDDMPALYVDMVY